MKLDLAGVLSIIFGVIYSRSAWDLDWVRDLEDHVTLEGVSAVPVLGPVDVADLSLR